MTDAMIAILDDEPEIVRLLSRTLEDAGFRTMGFRKAVNFQAALPRINPDICLVDLNLPDQDGLAIVYELAQARGSDVIIISGRGRVQDKVTGLELGADDYIVKPFDPEEVVARIKVLLRRRNIDATKPETRAAFAGRIVDFRDYTVTYQEAPTRLSQAEAALLRLFLESPNRLLTRAQIQDQLGGGRRDGMDRAIDVRVSRLRGKLSDNPKDPLLIKTIYGAGYLFVGDVEWSAV